MACVHDLQRQHAQIAMACCGTTPMYRQIWLHNTLWEDDNIYFVDIDDSRPGISIRVSIGTLPYDYWPCFSREQAELRADQILNGIRP